MIYLYILLFKQNTNSIYDYYTYLGTTKIRNNGLIDSNKI